MIKIRVRRGALTVIGLGLLIAAPARALAWLAPGHMATGAIAYDALARRDALALATIVRIEQAHPAQAGFEQRLTGLQGPARDASCSS